ncbi:hypothetical protein THAOC_24945, partial [Thalassiosira oceanica]
LSRTEVLNGNPAIQRLRARKAQLQQARQQQQQSTTSSAAPSAEDREDATDAFLRRNQLCQAKVPPANPGRLGGPGGQPLMKRMTSGDTALSPRKAHTEQKHLPTLGLAHVAARIAMEMDLQQTMTPHDPGSRPVQLNLERGTGQPNGGGENVGPTLNQVKLQSYTREQIETNDPKLQEWTPADERLRETYGDTIHHNDGAHLTGTVDPEDDATWQELYRQTITGSLPLYDLPNGKEENRYLDILAQIVEDVAAGKCNSEKLLCFPAFMLIKQFDSRNRNAKAVKELLSQRLDLWDKERYSALLRSVTDVWNRGNGTRSKKFDAMVKDGNLGAAMRFVEQKSGGGGGGKLYRHDDTDTKTGDQVIDVLRSKFPEPVIPEASHFDPSTSGPPEDTPPVYLSEEDILLRAKKLKSAAGMDGVDGQTARYWITSFGDRSKRLREALARIAMLLANGSPQYAMYRALNDARMLAADKEPGVRPLACGCIWMRLMAGAVIDSGLKVQARDACGNVQLCAGLGAGIEGNLHAVTRIFPQSAGWTEGEGTSNADIVEQLLTQSDEMRPDEGGPDDYDEEADADSTGGSRYEPNTDSELAKEFPEVLALWFADNEEDVGSARLNTQCLAYLVEHGPKEQGIEGAIREFEGGGQGWCTSLRALAEIAKTHPQSAHAAFTFCLQHKWMYMCRVIPGIAQLLEPLERVIREVWIPALLGSPPEELHRANVSRELLANAVRNGGLGIRNPIDTVERQHTTLISVTLTLVESIVRGEKLDMLAPLAHERKMKETLEFRDNIRLRYGLVPLNLEPICEDAASRVMWSTIYPVRREDRTRGDVSVYGFWARGTNCIFDVRVTDPSAKSY